MSFTDRLVQADTVVRVLAEHIWNVAPCAGRLIIVPYGYETHVPDVVRQQMRFVHTTTTRYVRFTPDFFTLDRQHPERMYLLEYKVSQTPIYSANRIAAIGSAANIPALRWQDAGQMEADAYDNYDALHTLGVHVVILYYCAYHERLLLCDYIERLRILHRDQVTTQTTRGSRTPFVNFDARSMRTLDVFLREEHGIVIDPATYTSTLQVLASVLPIQHHENSPLHSSNRQR